MLLDGKVVIFLSLEILLARIEFFLVQCLLMAHPADCFVGYIFEDPGIFLIDEKLCLTVFADICLLNFSAKDMHHKLCSIAKSKYRNTKLK